LVFVLGFCGREPDDRTGMEGSKSKAADKSVRPTLRYSPLSMASGVVRSTSKLHNRLPPTPRLRVRRRAVINFRPSRDFYSKAASYDA
jgi:hypothetical protein